MDKKSINAYILAVLCGAQDTIAVARPEEAQDAYWSAVVRQACILGIPSLFYHCMKSTRKTSRLPLVFMRELEKIYFKTAYKNNIIYRELAKVLAALQQTGIPVIVLKGAHLAEIVYGNVALRPMGDLDVLIRESDLAQAEKEILALGYDPPEHPRLKRLRVTRRSRILFSKPHCTNLEVHWVIDRPGSPFKIDNEGLWERARPAVIAGVNTLALSPEDLLLHMCWQGTANKLFSRGMSPFCDIAQILHHFGSAIAWDTVVDRAWQWRLEHCAYLALSLTRELLHVDIPEGTLALLQPAAADPRILACAREAVFNPDLEAENVLHLGTGIGLKDKTAHAVRNIFPSKKTIADRYNVAVDSPQIYFYYFIRFKQLLGKYKNVLWRLMVRDAGIAHQISLLEEKKYLKEWLHQTSDAEKP